MEHEEFQERDILPPGKFSRTGCFTFGEFFRERDVLLPEGLVTSHSKGSGRMYTNSKAREKLTTRCDSCFS
jgi:hypothetical protein